MKFADKVAVSLGDDQTDKVGFYLSSSDNDAGETKEEVQVGASVYSLTYREPSDRKDGRKGLTWWKV